jgi:hypothetical protein
LQGVAVDVNARGPEMAWLCGHREVRVNEAAKDFLTMDVEQWGCGGGPVAGHGYLKIDTTMRTLLVAVIGISRRTRSR